MKRLTLLTISAFFMFVFLGGLASAQPKNIKIGWIGPLSGPAAEPGISNKQGTILAMEEVNAKGGVYVAEYKKKIPLEVLFEDSQSKPEIGVGVAEKLITRDKVHVLFGEAFHSSVSVAIMELAPKYGIPIMSLQPISDVISNKIAKDPARYWSFWKMDVGSGAYARATLGTYQYLVDKKLFNPRNKTISFIVEDTDFGRTVAVRTKELFEGTGWKSVAMETVPLGHTDFYSQLTKLKSLDPDILLSLYTALSSGVAMIKQFHEVGAKPSHIAIYYPIRPELIPQTGKASDYLLWNVAVLDAQKIPSQKEFVDKIQKKWKVPANLDMTYGYDGVMNSVDSIERAGSLEPKKIVSALSKLNRKGILGRWVFEQSNHEIIDGPDYMPMPTQQTIAGKSEIIWPPAVATAKYVTPLWMK